MLVLTVDRHSGVTVDGPVIIKVLEIRGKYVKLGFDADKSVNIVRNDAIKREPKHVQE